MKLDVAALLEQLKGQGVTVMVNQKLRLVVRGPRKAITIELKQLLARHRDELEMQLTPVGVSCRIEARRAYERFAAAQALAQQPSPTSGTGSTQKSQP